LRSSLFLSVAVHLLITLIAINWVSFREVKFVPREVYAVEIVTAAEIPREEKKTVAPPEEEVKPPPKVEPDPEEEMPPPPDKPKPVKKKPPKKKAREVPTTQIEKTVTPEETTPEPAAESAPETGEMAFDTADFPFAHYISRMRRKIAAHWRVPAGSQGELLCVIYFRVTRDGTVMDAAIEQSSGLFMFDQAAQRAVVQSSPMPPLPQEYRDDYLGVHFSFTFREER
jgi:TonB family protein